MSEFAGNLPPKFIIFCRLGFEFSAHILPEARESVSLVVETSRSPVEVPCILQDAPLAVESSGAKLWDDNRDLTMAEKGCVLTSSDDDVVDLSAFVTDRLQCLIEGSGEKFNGNESVNV